MNRKLYVIVHPFFDRFCPSKEYRKNLYRLFSEPKGDFIVCESGADMEQTKGQILSINPELDIKLVETEFSKSEPSKGWDYLFKKVKDKDPSEIIVGGANLSGDEKSRYSECVGDTYHRIKMEIEKTRLDFNICYPFRKPVKSSSFNRHSR